MLYRFLLQLLPFFGRQFPLFVLVGPSGAGKGELGGRMLKKYRNLGRVVTTTSRSPKVRDGYWEENGIAYHFVSRAGFLWKWYTGALVEYSETHRNLYGLSWRALFRALWLGPSILDLDWCGALKIKRVYSGVVLIVIKPVSVEVLRTRIVNREPTLEEAEVELRLQNAEKELLEIEAKTPEFHHYLVNDDLSQAVGDLSLTLTNCCPGLVPVVRAVPREPAKKRAQCSG